MLKKFPRALFLLVGLIVGCASPLVMPLSPPPSSPAPTTIPSTTTTTITQKGTLRLATGEAQNVDDIPRLLAVDSLRAQGYTVELITFADTQLTTSALIKGDVDIALGGNQPNWAAIAKGAPIRAFLGRTNNTQLLLTPVSIQDCADLQGKKLGLNSATTTTGFMVDQYIQAHCPGTQPEKIIVASSINRRAGLLAGTLDASPSQTDDWLDLERKAPGKFHILINLGEEFPDLQISSYHMRQEFGAQHADLVKAFARAIILANRSIQDKNVLRAAIIKYLGFTPDVADQAAAAYLAVKQWDVNGGETEAKIKFTLDLLKKSGLDDKLTPDDVADLSFVNAVLDEIGRQ